MNRGERSFVIVSAQSNKGKKGKSNEGGRFISKSPGGAARKAFTRICRSTKVHGVCTMFVSMKETTEGSSGKVYKYRLKRSKLNPPQKVKIGKSFITYKYKNNVIAVKS